MPEESTVFESGKPGLISEVAGVVLAGGRSTRYGKNKALVKVDGISLIERVLRVLSKIFNNIYLMTNTPHEYAHLGLPMFEDEIKGLGPLGGIYTALKVIEEDYGFFVACDMPLLNEALIRHMVTSRNDFDVVIPKIDWKIESLHALYRTTCLPYIKDMIRRKEYQIFRFFDKVRVKYIEENEVRSFDPQLYCFFNINRPEELRRLKSP